jgi:hypothetical protein
MLPVVECFIVNLLVLVATIDTMEEVKRQESPVVRGKKGSMRELNICPEESIELTEHEQPNETLNELLATIDLKTMQLEIEEGLSKERPVNQKLARIRRLNVK